VPVRSATLLCDPACGKPRQYIEIMDNPRRDTLTVDLDAEGKPAAIYLNGKRDKTLDAYYREYIQNYEQFLRLLDESEEKDKEKP
ncbi:MAG: hypothetical protein NTY53_11695, partial [Kiritimatiellaeota bacterium]|nr:hypothetical protein [Kiritimatiellota bacterium]